mmetsp:Transcript_9858/g.29860  ORF Transcript_9858/g.29860 Transcript_9858/m.29860 type:complete len:88 (+) Transcript_9858:151-414(+)
MSGKIDSLSDRLTLASRQTSIHSATEKEDEAKSQPHTAQALRAAPKSIETSISSATEKEAKTSTLHCARTSGVSAEHHKSRWRYALL